MHTFVTLITSILKITKQNKKYVLNKVKAISLHNCTWKKDTTTNTTNGLDTMDYPQIFLTFVICLKLGGGGGGTWVFRGTRILTQRITKSKVEIRVPVHPMSVF